MNTSPEAAFNTQSQRLVAWTLRAFTWEQTRAKFERLAAKSAGAGLQAQLKETVAFLDTRPVSDLTGLLAQAGSSA